MITLLVAGLVALFAGAPVDSTYVATILAERTEREARLRADDGWLTVAGLHWFMPGENSCGTDRGNTIILPAGSAPAAVGRFILRGDSVGVEVLPGVPVTCDGRPVTQMTLRSDEEGRPDVLVLDQLRLFVIRRTRGLALRVRYLDAPARREFQGLDYFAVDPSWRIEARFVPYDPPRPIVIPSVIGTVDTVLAPGCVEFERGGETYRLDPASDSTADGLFFIFKDETSGVETYPPGRFLSTDPPAGGTVVLDFNRAVSPPCAYTEYATCPLPPLQNALALRIPAGEKLTPGHHP